MGLIAALLGFVSLISNQTQNGALKKKRDHHHGSEEMAVAYCQGHGRLVSCFLPDDNDGGSLPKKGGGGERENKAAHAVPLASARQRPEQLLVVGRAGNLPAAPLERRTERPSATRQPGTQQALLHRSLWPRFSALGQFD